MNIQYTAEEKNTSDKDRTMINSPCRYFARFLNMHIYVIYVKIFFPSMVADIMSKITVKTKEISQYIYVHT